MSRGALILACSLALCGCGARFSKPHLWYEAGQAFQLLVGEGWRVDGKSFAFIEAPVPDSGLRTNRSTLCVYDTTTGETRRLGSCVPRLRPRFVGKTPQVLLLTDAEPERDTLALRSTKTAHETRIYRAATGWRVLDACEQPGGSLVALVEVDKAKHLRASVVNLESQQRTILDGGTHPIARLQWSPDGSTLLIVGLDSLATVRPGDIRGGRAAPRPLKLPVEIPSETAWSPDSTHLAGSGFVVNDGAPVWVVDMGTGGFDQIALLPQRVVVDSCWSPDGRYLACATVPLTPGDRNYDLQVINLAEGSSHVIVGSSGEPIITPAWSPSGQWLAYVRGTRLESVRVRL